MNPAPPVIRMRLLMSRLPLGIGARRLFPSHAATAARDGVIDGCAGAKPVPRAQPQEGGARRGNRHLFTKPLWEGWERWSPQEPRDCPPARRRTGVSGKTNDRSEPA